MNNKTILQLERIARDHAFYSPEKRYEALIELEKRNSLSEELSLMKRRFEDTKEDEKKSARYSWRNNNPDLTTDESAPQLYSHRSIYIFSILFSTVAGSFLMARNLKELNYRRLSILIVVIGFLLAFLSSHLVSLLEYHPSMVISINAILSYLMIEFFWNRFIGKDIKYRKRSIGIPLVIWIAITTVLVFLIIYSYTTT